MEAKRDWGSAADYVEGMWRILQHSEPDDFVLATGETYSVRTLIETAFKKAGRSIVWSGSGVDETGQDAETGNIIIRVDPRYFRPTEVDLLIGDATKAKEKLGWTPQTTFDELISAMVKADCKAVGIDIK